MGTNLNTCPRTLALLPGVSVHVNRFEVLDPKEDGFGLTYLPGEMGEGQA